MIKQNIPKSILVSWRKKKDGYSTSNKIKQICNFYANKSFIEIWHINHKLEQAKNNSCNRKNKDLNITGWHKNENAYWSKVG